MTEEVRVVLVHAGSRIMPEINERLVSYALEIEYRELSSSNDNKDREEPTR